MRSPLTAEEARVRTDEIRAVITAIGDDQEMVTGLLEAAARDRVHLALSYDTYPAYVDDQIRTEVGRASARSRGIVVRLRDLGLSPGAIGAVLGQDQSTVRPRPGGEFGGAVVQDVRDRGGSKLVGEASEDRPGEEHGASPELSGWRKRARAELDALQTQVEVSEAVLPARLERLRAQLFSGPLRAEPDREEADDAP